MVTRRTATTPHTTDDAPGIVIVLPNVHLLDGELLYINTFWNAATRRWTASLEDATVYSDTSALFERIPVKHQRDIGDKNVVGRAISKREMLTTLISELTRQLRQTTDAFYDDRITYAEHGRRHRLTWRAIEAAGPNVLSGVLAALRNESRVVGD